MKKILPIILLLFVSNAFSQITINSSDMPNAGDSVLISISNSIGSNSVDSTGANYTWDYSTLVPNLQRYEKFDSPFGFPLPFNLVFNILNTSYGNENNILTSLPLPGVTLDMAYDFLKESSTKFQQVGAGYTINGTPLPFLYTANDVIYRFPLDYLNTDSCDYKFGLPIPTIGYYGQTGHRVNVVDGWGSVTTPFGTFNALRVKSAISAIDTINAFSFGLNIPRPLRYEYKWLATAEQIPVLKIDANVVGGVPTVTNVEYIDSIVPGVPSLGIADNVPANFYSSAFPNPCVESIQVNYFLSDKGAIKISFMDVLGKTIHVVLNDTELAGSHQKNINIADYRLPNGVYFLVLQTDKHKEVHKIVVGK